MSPMFSVPSEAHRFYIFYPDDQGIDLDEFWSMWREEPYAFTGMLLSDGVYYICA